ncbi:hypothetical protein EMPS_02422 [Entomortierella parvispora]|uniref:Protein FAM72A n=1 Tax=Entomortierella parvispora TaxID=205924 RepID=A0A9P3LTJ3_9FUNG|nr:hypothetical protein EMPS_02422 [Entomortierella parvispora]
MPGINSSSSSHRRNSESQQQTPQQQAYVTRLNDQTIVVNLPRTSIPSTSFSSSPPLLPTRQSAMITPPSQMQPLSSSPVQMSRNHYPSHSRQQQPHQNRQARNGRPRRESLVASDIQLGGPLPLHGSQHPQQMPTSDSFSSSSSLPRENSALSSNNVHSSYVLTHAVHNSSSNSNGSGSRAQYRSGPSSTQYPSSQHPQQYPQQQQQSYRLQPIAPAPGPPGPDNFSAQQSRLQAQQSQQQQQQHQRQQQLMQQQQYQLQQQRQYQYQPQQQPHNNNNNTSLSIQQQLQQPFQSSTTTGISTAPSLHPQFQAKAVCRLTCKSCLTDVCMRGMRAILLADTRVELYSTDRPPAGVQLVYDDYRTRNCKCRIRDVACLGCGNTLGYHVTQPCEKCLSACNNGHFWMFHSDGVSCTERYLPAAYARTVQASRDNNGSYASSRRSSLATSLSSSASGGSETQHQRVGDSAEGTEPDLSFRRRTSIHDIEYNNAVRAGPHASRSAIAATVTRSTTEGRGHQDIFNNDGRDDDSEAEDYDEDKDSEAEDEEDEEEIEEKPVLMLWAALHAQEERYLQQMQLQLVLQQQQQQQIQQRLQQHLHQQQERELQERADVDTTIMTTSGAPPATAPTVGSRYHSMISTAISNASMTLWDENRATNQYEQVCR